MNERKTLQEYLKVPDWHQTLSFCLLAAAAVCTVIGIVYSVHNYHKEAVPFDPLNTKAEYSYLDVIGISDWSLKDNDNNCYYYAVEDVDGYYSVVTLNSSVFSQMKAQNEYWNASDANASVPDPYRIYGMSKTISSEMQSHLENVYDLSSSQFAGYFGTMYLNTKATPATGILSAVSVIGFLSAICGAAFLFSFHNETKDMNQSLDRLEQQNMLTTAAAELQAPSHLFCTKGERLILTDHFLFDKAHHMIIPYSDICWIYKRVTRSYMIATGGSLVACTQKKTGLQFYSFAGDGKKDPNILNIMNLIYRKNPHCMIGYTKANINAYHAYRKNPTVSPQTQAVNQPAAQADNLKTADAKPQLPPENSDTPKSE